MKNIGIISESESHSAINIGSLNTLTEHSIIHPKTKKKIKGKLFIKDLTKSTGSELSFSILPPKTELPYFHIHKENEETYIIIKGSGDFQVNNECFPIEEGSIIRVAPSAIRGLRNSSEETMIYIVIQTRENSLIQYSSDEGERVIYDKKWK